MTTTRKQYSPQFKARVALEAIRGERTLSQLGSQFKVHPMQIAKWRKAAIDQLSDLFVDGRTRKPNGTEADSDALYQEIGRLKVELDWTRRRELIRTLVKRVEIGPEAVNIVFRVEPDTPNLSGTHLESNSLPDCGRRVSPVLANLFLHYVFDCW